MYAHVNRVHSSFPLVLPQSSRFFLYAIPDVLGIAEVFCVWRGERTGLCRSCTVLLRAQKWLIRSVRVVRSGCGTGQQQKKERKKKGAYDEHRDGLVV